MYSSFFIKSGFICPKLLWMLLGKIEEFCHAQQLIRPKTDKTTGLSHCGLVIYIKKYLKAKKKKKKNYGNSNISLCKNIIFKKIL